MKCAPAPAPAPARRQVDGGTWCAPDVLPGSGPGARAFHAAVACGRGMLLFGGHILSYEGDTPHSRKRRLFFNDVWRLDTVSGSSRQAAGCSSN